MRMEGYQIRAGAGLQAPRIPGKFGNAGGTMEERRFSAA
jgi:hypothetical protein